MARIYTKPESVTRPAVGKVFTLHSNVQAEVKQSLSAVPVLIQMRGKKSHLASHFCHMTCFFMSRRRKTVFNPSHEEHLGQRCGGKKLNDNS